jgi:hypothetical protein
MHVLIVSAPEAARSTAATMSVTTRGHSVCVASGRVEFERALSRPEAKVDAVLVYLTPTGHSTDSLAPAVPPGGPQCSDGVLYGLCLLQSLSPSHDWFVVAAMTSAPLSNRCKGGMAIVTAREVMAKTASGRIICSLQSQELVAVDEPEQGASDWHEATVTIYDSATGEVLGSAEKSELHPLPDWGLLVDLLERGAVETYSSD